VKKGAPKIFKSANMVPSDYSEIIYKSGSKYLAKLIYDYRKNAVLRSGPFFRPGIEMNAGVS